MPGDVLGSDIGTIYYIRSDTAFNIARARGLWEVFRMRVAGRRPYLKPFREAVGESSLAEAYYLGVQSVVTDEIVGSLGRAREFSRAFLPVGSKTMQRERWRQSYTWLLCGQVRPPIRVCGAGGGYYVVNGHHRVSAARYLGVRTMLAHVSDIDTTKVTGVGGEDRSGQPECVAVCEI
jgi:hypothetical protein